MDTVLLEKCPALVNRKRVLLQQDNSRPHTVKKTLQQIDELEGIELLLHPSFSPNLEPSDYYLFRSMAQFLRGKSFNL
jgi:histone-lysine N-methyltransferase SETMAR